MNQEKLQFDYKKYILYPNLRLLQTEHLDTQDSWNIDHK